MVRSWLPAALALTAALTAPQFAHALPLDGDPCGPSGQVVVTDPAGDVSNPQLDILDLTIAEHGGGAYADRFLVRLRVDRLDTPNPASAVWWIVTWNGPSRHASTQLVMSTCGSQAPTFGYTYGDSNGSGSSGTPDSAWFSGNGEIVFVLSRDKIGSPQPGDTLRDIGAFTWQFAQPGGVCVPGVFQQQDQAGAGTYLAGSCVLAAPVRTNITALRLGPAVPGPATRAVRFTLETPAGLLARTYHAAVFDVNGRRVRDFGARPAEAGASWIEWNLRDDAGARVRPGTYWMAIGAGAQLTSRGFQVVR